MGHHHGCHEAHQHCHTHPHCHACHAEGHSHHGGHGDCQGAGDWEAQKMEWLIGITKEAYQELLMTAIREKLAEKVSREVDELADIATDKFTGWWKLKRDKIQLKRRFRKRFEEFAAGS